MIRKWTVGPKKIPSVWDGSCIRCKERPARKPAVWCCHCIEHDPARRRWRGLA